MPYYIETNTDGTPKLNSVIRTSKDGYSLPLIDITNSINKQFIGSGREVAQPRYYVKTTNSGEPISGTLTTVRPVKDLYIDITKDFSDQSKIDAYLLDENAIYGIAIIGHSNATGMSWVEQAMPASFVNTSINSNKKVEWNEAESAMIIADNILSTPQDRLAQHIFQPTFYGNINPIVLVGNEMSRLLKERTGKTIQFITISGATNGSVIDRGFHPTQPELSKNSIHFQYLQQGIQAAKTYATSIGKTFKVPFMILINGEVEAILYGSVGEGALRYNRALYKYRKELYKMVADITLDNYQFPIFRHQLHGQQMTEENNTLVKEIVLKSSFATMPVVLPSYQVSILSGFDHWDTTALFHIYGSFVNSILRHQYHNTGVFFKHKKATCVDTTITITFDIPTPPLRIDTSRGLEANHGFTVTDYLGVDIPILSMQINANTIVLNVQRNPTPGHVHYKAKRPYVPDLNRPASYIADSQFFKFFDLTISNYLLSFKQLI